MIRFKRSLITPILLLIFNTGVSQGKERTRKSQQIPSTSFYITENETNDTKVAKLGQQIQNVILEGNTDAFMTLFDTKGFGKLVTYSTRKDNSLKSYRDNFLSGFKSNISVFPKKLIDEVESGSYYNFVNYSYNDEMNTYYMLFRMFSDETGINYHHYRVSKLNGKFTFNDVYVYLTGEELSKTLERFYLYALPKKSLFDFFGKSNADEFVKMAQGVDFYNEGDFKNAYKKLNTLKGDLKNDKFVLVIKAVCASNISDELYKDSMKNIMEHHPDDPTLYLSQIDYFLLNENYDRAQNLFDKLKEDTGDDFLDLLKGNVEFERMNYEKALSYFKNIARGYPDLFEGHSSMLSCYSLLKKYDKCIDILNFLVEDGYAKDDIIGFVEELDANNENILIGLAKSEAFKSWKKV
ncbi:hypothetical protein EYD45_00070 [Hyunsoonleella flava]|uniref:Tetratricopeptide repeat protein n=1 Tax=Hyunsoonleella flava TaxID=2527939 RepID=A0A4Q9FGY2_9FLAO|nr:hypothetical protein [Hyunsoonleella flava]TBN06318.1 hypothetical protein EYD45_00070 [Hyunsoonleella flava]